MTIAWNESTERQLPTTQVSCILVFEIWHLVYKEASNFQWISVHHVWNHWRHNNKHCHLGKCVYSDETFAKLRKPRRNLVSPWEELRALVFIQALSPGSTKIFQGEMFRGLWLIACLKSCPCPRGQSQRLLRISWMTAEKVQRTSEHEMQESRVLFLSPCHPKAQLGITHKKYKGDQVYCLSFWMWPWNKQKD